ncbi:MAG: hypothetical protein ACLQBK_24735 [Candidatus Sulfotelmatobacter sp.]
MLASACTVVIFAGFARAQQLDIAAGGSALFAAGPISASQAFPPPAEKGGSYPSVSAELVFKNHYGFEAESAFRYKQGLYNGYQRYRPVFSDVNGVYAPRIGPKTSADFMAGFGVQTLTFYNQFGSCSGVCPTSISTNHFMLHAGGGMRYYFWRHFFVRPEAHYYYVVGNTEFHSGNVLRLGASVGYSFGRK